MLAIQETFCHFKTYLEVLDWLLVLLRLLLLGQEIPHTIQRILSMGLHILPLTFQFSDGFRLVDNHHEHSKIKTKVVHLVK